jgi:hypothetical protein
VGTKEYRRASVLDYYDDECLLEVGSGLSSFYLAGIAAGCAVPFYTIDTDEDVLFEVQERLLLDFKVSKCWGLLGRAEVILNSWFDYPDRTWPKFTWIDGFDWPYDQIDPKDYTRLSATYVGRGTPITKENSANAHLKLVVELQQITRVGAVAAFDDTWFDCNTTYDGKGRYAVPYLLNHGWEVLDQISSDGETVDGYVTLKRVL